MNGTSPQEAGPSGRIGAARDRGSRWWWDRELLGEDPDVDALLAVADPAGALETVHWGRNYLWRSALQGSDGSTLDVVVKQFRHDALRPRLRRRLGGSKAHKSWAVAWALERMGIATPHPVALIESERADGPAAYVTLRLEGWEEVRYRFRRWNVGDETDPAAGEVLAAIARLARHMHDQGLWHRDFSAGNVLLSPQGLELAVLDLNRARLLSRVSLWQRLRDLGRLPAHRREHRDLLRQVYFEPGSVPSHAVLFGEWCYHAFHGRHRLKQRLRGAATSPPVKGRGLTGLVRARSTYPHLAPPPSGAAVRDRTVWDPLSDQPHQHASPLAKLATRLVDLPDHLHGITTAALSLPRVLRRTRQLLAQPRRTVLDGMGVAVRPQPDCDALLAALADLGCHHVALRVHPWETDHDAEVQTAHRLAQAGHELLVALPQNRTLVRDPARWRAAIEELAERLGPYAGAFQLGQAINRSKWGVWTLREYFGLAEVASEILRSRCPQAKLVGPGVIDFEPHSTLAVVNRRRGLELDALASLLYVDRRGAPENRQLGLDAEGKAAFFLAVAETSRHCGPESWITEVNWPLREGPHSPAGQSVSVDEQAQADYLVRFYLLTHGAGFAQRVYWWQLVAKGYGLIDPVGAGIGRRRPAFAALATLTRELAGARRIGALEVPEGARAPLFETPAGRVVAACWATGAPVEVVIPGRPQRLREQDGTELALEPGQSIRFGSAVRFVEWGEPAAIPSSATPGADRGR